MHDPIGGFLGGLFHFVGEVFDELFELLELPRHAAHDDEAAFVLVGLVLLLVGSAVGIGWHTWARSRPERKPLLDVRGWFASAASLIWLLPVAGVVALLGIRYTDARHEPTKPPRIIMFDADGQRLGELQDVTHDVTTGGTEPVPAEGAVATSIPVETAPWTEVSRVDLDDRSLVTVTSKQFATVDEAEQDALREATELLWEDAKRTDPRVAAAGPLPRDLVQRAAVRRRHVEGPIERHTETSVFEVYRVHLQVELSPRVRAEVRPFWRSEIVGRRLWGLSGLAGFLTVAFGTLTAYLRLDDLSAGKYRNRLRFAAASLVTAGGLVAAVLL